jgi:sugar/nucleoside kinase (ribokinase family)
MTPDILLAGHIVKDITNDGWRPGGGVTYGAAQALRLGLSVAVVTSCDAGVDPHAVLPDVDWRVLRSTDTTTFENRYTGSRREQTVLARARKIGLTDIPDDWRGTPLILLCPVIGEIDPSLGRQLHGGRSFVALGAQGWLRRVEGQRVVVGPAEPSPDWLAGDAVFVSEEDVTDADGVAAWQAHVPIVILTRARLGCTLWDAGGRHDLPAFSVDEVDPTGAGDVFMTAFCVRFHETRDAIDAARFGAAAAALAVTRPGIEGVGGRNEIEALLRSREVVRR